MALVLDVTLFELSDVHNGRNSVNGTNSVVKEIVSDYSVAVGSPARKISVYKDPTKNTKELIND